jgi:hypothetical protein
MRPRHSCRCLQTPCCGLGSLSSCICMLRRETIGFVCLTGTTPWSMPQLIDIDAVADCSQCGAVGGHPPVLSLIAFRRQATVCATCWTQCILPHFRQVARITTEQSAGLYSQCYGARRSLRSLRTSQSWLRHLAMCYCRAKYATNKARKTTRMESLVPRARGQARASGETVGSRPPGMCLPFAGMLSIGE